VLTPAQLEDLAQVHAIANRFKADIVIIGAAALLCFMDIGRFTRDIDLVLALDLEGFTAFADDLRTLGWTQEERREHRWRGPSGSIIDLLRPVPNFAKRHGLLGPRAISK
jgi:hypothetical protein